MSYGFAWQQIAKYYKNKQLLQVKVRRKDNFVIHVNYNGISGVIVFARGATIPEVVKLGATLDVTIIDITPNKQTFEAQLASHYRKKRDSSASENTQVDAQHLNPLNFFLWGNKQQTPREEQHSSITQQKSRTLPYADVCQIVALCNGGFVVSLPDKRQGLIPNEFMGKDIVDGNLKPEQLIGQYRDIMVLCEHGNTFVASHQHHLELTELVYKCNSHFSIK